MSNSAAVNDPKPTESADGPAAEPSPEPADNPRLRPRGSNQVGMRQFNDRVVLQALRVHGSLPKADLARLTGLLGYFDRCALSGRVPPARTRTAGLAG